MNEEIVFKRGSKKTESKPSKKYFMHQENIMYHSNALLNIERLDTIKGERYPKKSLSLKIPKENWHPLNQYNDSILRIQREVTGLLPSFEDVYQRCKLSYLSNLAERCIQSVFLSHGTQRNQVPLLASSIESKKLDSLRPFKESDINYNEGLGSFHYFPRELFEYLFSFLSPEDLSRLSLANKTFQNLTNSSEQWRFFSKNYMSFYSLSSFSPKQFYVYLHSFIKMQKNLEEIKYVSSLKKMNLQTRESDLPWVIDGHFACAKNSHRQIEVYDFQTETHTILPFSSSDRIFVKSPYLLCVGSKIKVWDLLTFKEIADFENNSHIASVAIEGTSLYSSSTQGVFKKWDLTTKKCVEEFHPKGIFYCSDFFVEDNDLFCICSGSGTVIVYDLIARKEKLVLNQGTGEHAQCCVKAGHSLIVGTSKGLIKIFNLQTGECSKSFRVCLTPIIYLSRQGHLLFAISSGSTRPNSSIISVWNLLNYQCVEAIKTCGVFQQRISFYDTNLIMARDSGLYQCWNFKPTVSDVLIDLMDQMQNPQKKENLEVLNRIKKLPEEIQEGIYTEYKNIRRSLNKSPKAAFWEMNGKKQDKERPLAIYRLLLRLITNDFNHGQIEKGLKEFSRLPNCIFKVIQTKNRRIYKPLTSDVKKTIFNEFSKVTKMEFALSTELFLNPYAHYKTQEYRQKAILNYLTH